MRQDRGEALAKQGGRMIPDLGGRLVDAPRRLFAHRMPLVQHPVHRGNADAGLGCYICNGRTCAHGGYLRGMQPLMQSKNDGF
jgi:hypothetical protein